MNEKEIVVFIVRRNTVCCECKEELGKDSFIRLIDKGALCLSCADLDHLDYLPSGNTALTRRAKKNSKIYAVVVQWNRTRKHYERQGILVESEAIERAEKECLKDAELREIKRRKEQLKQEESNQKYIADFAKEIRKYFPNCPKAKEFQIACYACRKYSGRIGRSLTAKRFAPEAIELAVRAHIRHAYTNYDELLMNGWERWFAREKVHDKVEDTFEQWRGEVK